MKVFIFALLFMLLISFNYIQSMNGGGSSSPPRPIIKYHAGQLVLGRLRSNGKYRLIQLGMFRTKHIPIGWSEEDYWGYWEKRRTYAEETRLESGDVLVRRRKAIAEVHGLSFYKIGLLHTDQSRVEPKAGDLHFRAGVPIARYVKKGDLIAPALLGEDEEFERQPEWDGTDIWFP